MDAAQHLVELGPHAEIETVQASVEDGSTRLVLDFEGFHAGEHLFFTIDVDDTIASGALDVTMIAGSEMEQSKVTVTSSTNTPVSGIFDGNNKAVVDLPVCV